MCGHLSLARISAVALAPSQKFYLADMLPKAPYLTRLDAYIYISFLTIVAIFVAISSVSSVMAATKAIEITQRTKQVHFNNERTKHSNNVPCLMLVSQI